LPGGAGFLQQPADRQGTELHRGPLVFKPGKGEDVADEPVETFGFDVERVEVLGLLLLSADHSAGEHVEVKA
jgi:hypothetical protein